MHGLEDQGGVGGGVLRQEGAKLLKVAGIGNHGGEMFECLKRSTDEYYEFYKQLMKLCPNKDFLVNLCQQREEEYGTIGGDPFGCLVGDYYFDHSPQDVELLRGVAQISAAAHAPFITAAGPTLMGFDSWQLLWYL